MGPPFGNKKNVKLKKTWTVLGLVAVVLSTGCREDRNLPFLLREDTGVNFSNDLLESDSFNIIQYMYYYNGGGVAAGDLNNDGLTDLFFTGNETSNRLYLNRGNFSFTDATEQTGIGTTTEWSTGVTLVDINSDGWLDIYVCQLGDYKGKKGRNHLYVNQGIADGVLTFKEEAGSYGLDFSGFATQAAFFDYDLDGDLDVYLLNHSVHTIGNYGKAASLRPQSDDLAGDRLLRNDEIPPPGKVSGTFTDVTTAAGILSSRIGYGLGLGIGDLNGDGWPDIYVSNDFHENDYLYLNKGDGTFSDEIEQAMSCTSHFSMGNAIADWNNDGLPDIISLDMKPESEELVKNTVGSDAYNIYLLKRSFGYYHQFSRNMLHLNRGNIGDRLPQFSEVAQIAGLEATDWSWCPLVTDLDNDGRKDIFITNGIWRRPNDLDYLRYISNRQIQAVASDQTLVEKMPMGKAENYAFRNRGNLTFEDVSTAWGLNLYGVSNGAVFADLDNDGDQDLILNNLNARASIYENNNSGGNNYLKIHLRGKAPNVSAIGAKVRIQSGTAVQSQELFLSQGYQSSVDTRLLFGVGQAVSVDRVEVQWPAGGETILEQVPANQTLEIIQSETTIALNDKTYSIPPALGSDNDLDLNFVHRENKYVDFNNEPLIPHLLSTQGPRLAIGDVNGDGWDDLYICGAKGQSGKLFYREASGDFQPAPDFFVDNLQGEEVDAAFFDADSDGDLDLFIVNGGGDVETPSFALIDRLYINDGFGNFQRSDRALGLIASNGSCVVPLDFDRDGAVDLFVGARSIPGNYGHDPQSYLLQNDGSGKFRDVSAQHLPRDGKLGMVTDAVFLETAESRSLVVVGEWMPVQFLRIGPQIWQQTSLDHSSGWWNRIQLADCNADGRPDLVLGNWGLNNFFDASPEEPLKLYVKDFDGNYKSEPLITYFRNGKEYPLASIDELMNQMPDLRQSMGSYANFAKLTFPEIFGPDAQQGSLIKKAETLASAIALSDGTGNYRLQPFPEMAQLSPVFGIQPEDFNADGYTDLFLAGNFYGSRPDLGIYDASSGTLLFGDGRGGFRIASREDQRWRIGGQVRDMAVLSGPGQKMLIIARNDEAVAVKVMAGTGEIK